VLYESVKSTKNSKTATNGSGPKRSNLSTQTQYLQYDSIDKKHIFAQVKFEVDLSISFTVKLASKKK
jgi:hypothetical protein